MRAMLLLYLKAVKKFERLQIPAYYLLWLSSQIMATTLNVRVECHGPAAA